MTIADDYFSTMDEEYFTTLDTSLYSKPSLYQDLMLGESTHPGVHPIQAVDTAINRGLPSTMINIFPPERSRGDKGNKAAMDKISDVQRDAIAERLYVNKMTFQTHAPVIDIMGLKGSQTGRGGVELSEGARRENENLIKNSIDFTDKIADKIGQENPIITIHTTNSVGSIKKFDSGYKKNDGSPVMGVENMMIDLETGKPMDAKSKFKWMPISKKNSLERQGYNFVEGTKQGDKGLFEIPPETHVRMANSQALEQKRSKLAEALEKQKRYGRMLREEEFEDRKDRARIQTAIGDLNTTITTMRSDISHIRHMFEKGEKFEKFKLIDDLSRERVPKSIANLAMHSLEDTKTNPVIAVENEPEWQLGSDPELLVDWVEKGREEFAKRLVNEKGYGWDKARSKARDLIGMTLDTGHINTLKKQHGWDDKKIKEWTKKMAPGVKFVHIADNIGEYGMDSHLLIGRGDTPVNEMIDILKENGFKGQTTFEAFTTEGGYSVPTWANVSGLNASIYETRAHPSVPEVSFDLSTPYSTPNMMYKHKLPDLHFSEWGGPWSGLPSTFGASRGGKRDRFSGTPTA